MLPLVTQFTAPNDPKLRSQVRDNQLRQSS